jgi:hypothetical protein
MRPGGEGAERGLLRTMRQGEAKIPAFLEDYAALAHGLLELHRSSGEQRWLDEARALMLEATHRFSAEAEHGGGYFDTLADQDDLFVRLRSTYDGAVPSGNSLMVHNLIDLFELTEDRAYLQQAADDLRSFATPLATHGRAMVHMQHALLRLMRHDSSLLAQPGEQPPEVSDPSQRRRPLAAAVAPERVRLGEGPVSLQIVLEVGEGYHLNAHQPGDEKLVPTEVMVEPAGALELEATYPRGTEEQFPFADGAIHVYEGRVVISATLRKKAALPAEATPRLLLRYQVCTEQSCLEPRVSDLPVAIETDE